MDQTNQDQNLNRNATTSDAADVPLAPIAVDPFPGLQDVALDFTALRIVATGDRPDRVVAAMDRPESRNAIDQTMFDEFHALCGWLEDHPMVLILTGTETAHPKTGRRQGLFASGADIRQLRERRRGDALRGVNSRAFDRIHQLPMPVVAAIDGYALGGGAELAYAADFRLATPSLKLGQPETGLGVVAAAGPCGG